MYHQIADHTIDEKFTSWVSAMKQSSREVTIGNNPILPSIIHKTWNWPAVFIEFFYNDTPVALVSFVSIRNTWVSLPHFDHDSLWVNSRFPATMSLKFHYPKIQNKDDASSFFYDLSYRILAGISNTIHHDTIIRCDVEPDDFSQFNDGYKSAKFPNVIARNRYPVFEYQDFQKVIPTLALQSKFDLQFNQLSSSVRRKIRKSKKNGIRVNTGGVEYIDCFYEVYRYNIRKLGSFGLPRHFFYKLVSGYKFGFAKVFMAELDEKPVGGAILLNFGSYAENGWFASLHNYNHKYVTYALHDSMIRYAIQNKCKIYSFGRSTNKSTGHKYKKQWGTTDIPLVLSSVKKMRVNAGKFKFIHRILRVLPDEFSNSFDGLVSNYVY